MRSVLVFDRVHARDAMAPNGRPRGALVGMTLALGPGTHALLGTPEDGTGAAFEIATGARTPARGRVTVGGVDPARSPVVRARIGALGVEPQLPSTRTVDTALRTALRARGDVARDPEAVLRGLGLSHLRPRSLRSLSFAEERAVELALALSTPSPILLALHEPLMDVAVARTALVRDRVRQLADAGACVLVTTSSPADARTLADHVVVLQRGEVPREIREGEGVARPALAELTAWVSRGARELTAALAKKTAVHAVNWEDAALAAPGSADAAITAVRVRGHDLEALSLALTDAAVEVEAAVEAIVQGAPSLESIGSPATPRLMLVRPHADPVPVATPEAERAAGPGAPFPLGTAPPVAPPEGIGGPG